MCSHAHVNKWIMVHFQPCTHIQWLIHSIVSSYCQHSADRKQSFHKFLRQQSRNQILSNQRHWVNVFRLFFLMPEFDGTATKQTCVDVSDVMINVASDRSDHQCCGSCMALAWLLLLCQLGCQKWKVFQWCCICTRPGSVYSECACCSETGKITKVLVIRIILVLLLVSFCWIILVII